MPEPYAVRETPNASGNKTYYRTRADYLEGRGAVAASRAAQRRRLGI